MAHTNTWNNATPAISDQAGAGYDNINDLKLDTDERMSLQHYWGDSTTYDGAHIPGKASVVENQSTAATIVANAGDFLAAYNGSVAFASDTLVMYVKVGTENATNGTWTAISTPHTDNSNYIIEGDTNSLPVVVYGPDTPTIWEDLDISAEVGSKRCLCFLRVVGAGAYFARRNGDEGEICQNNTNYASGCTGLSLPGGSSQGYVTIETDASGVFEHKCSGSVTVYLLGFVG